MSEGAVALVLERADDAIKRGAKSLVELAGASTTNDAFQIARPAEDGRGLAVAIKQCLEDANEPASAVNLILNGSTGTAVDDQLEDVAVESIYGNEQPHRATSKRHIGVAMGTSVLFDVALATEVLRRNQVPAPLAESAVLDANISTIMCNGVGLNGLFGAALIRRPVW